MPNLWMYFSPWDYILPGSRTESPWDLDSISKWLTDLEGKEDETGSGLILSLVHAPAGGRNLSVKATLFGMESFWRVSYFWNDIHTVKLGKWQFMWWQWVGRPEGRNLCLLSHVLLKTIQHDANVSYYFLQFWIILSYNHFSLELFHSFTLL